MDVLDDSIMYIAQKYDHVWDHWKWAFPEAYRSQSYDLPSLRERLLAEAEKDGEYRIVRTSLSVVESFEFDMPRATAEGS